MKFMLLVTLLFSFSIGSANDHFPNFQSVKKDGISILNVDPNLIIHETDDDYILKSPLTNFASYDYYYLQLSPHRHENLWFFKNSNVVFAKSHKYLIVEVRNEKQLLEIASKAHHEGGFCGMIQKLSGTPITIKKTPAPDVVREKRPEVEAATKLIKIENILQYMETMVSWKTRFESDASGEQTGEKLKEMYEKIIPADRSDVTVDLVTHRGSPQKSIVVRILGSQNPDKLVILGSHIDSINKSDKTDAPGADDNASGTSTNMEVFRVLMESNFVPKSTIEIHGYAAEEIGLVGSKEMAEDYKRNKKQVISMVQFDMNAYAKNGPKITFVSNGTDRGLTSQLQKLVGMYNNIPSTTGFLIFGSSDHASWSKQGFPVAFPTEDPFGFNGDIHTNQDTMDKVNSKKQIEEFGKHGVAYLMHFSS